MRRRELSERDRAAWARYVQHVAPMPGAAVPPAPEPDPPNASSAGPTAPQAALLAPPRRALAALEVGAAPGGVDRATWTRFRTGKLAPARTLDLHGSTAQSAHSRLREFLGQSIAERLRCVEVITGRGAGEHGGVIRRELPLWLNDAGLRPLILAATHPHAANPGAVRLLLRRVRERSEPGPGVKSRALRN